MYYFLKYFNKSIFRFISRQLCVSGSTNVSEYCTYLTCINNNRNSFKTITPADDYQKVVFILILNCYYRTLKVDNRARSGTVG